MINGNAVGGIVGYGKTFILTDENGNELTGVVVDEEVILTADPVKDIREGKVAATDAGVVTGSKNIPAYRTEQGVTVISDGDAFTLNDLTEYDMYNYTELQCIIAPLTSDAMASVASDKIVLYDNVYSTNAETSLAVVSKDFDNKLINLNIQNNSGKNYVVHYFTYKEEI